MWFGENTWSGEEVGGGKRARREGLLRAAHSVCHTSHPTAAFLRIKFKDFVPSRSQEVILAAKAQDRPSHLPGTSPCAFWEEPWLYRSAGSDLAGGTNSLPPKRTPGLRHFQQCSPAQQPPCAPSFSRNVAKRHLWRHQHLLTACRGNLLQWAWTGYLTLMWLPTEEMNSHQILPLLITLWPTQSSCRSVRRFPVASISSGAACWRESRKLQGKSGLKPWSCLRKAVPEVRKGDRICLWINKHHFMYQKISHLTELPKTSGSQLPKSGFYCAGSREEKTMFYKEKKLDMVLRMFISFIILCMNLL